MTVLSQQKAKSPPLAHLFLTVLSGFVDTSTLIGPSKFFSGHVTGNLVIFAASIIQKSHFVHNMALWSLPIFALSVLAASWIFHFFHKRQAVNPSKWLLLSSAGCLILAAILTPFSNPQQLVPSFLAVAAMGMINSLHRLQPEWGPPTTVMTMTLTQTCVDLYTRYTTVPRPPNTFESHRMLIILLSFLLGCCLASLCSPICGLVDLLLPAAGLIGLAYVPGVD